MADVATGTSASDGEEDNWETSWSTELEKLVPASLTSDTAGSVDERKKGKGEGGRREGVADVDKAVPRQRGRGAFTYGDTGLYCDRLLKNNDVVRDSRTHSDSFDLTDLERTLIDRQQDDADEAYLRPGAHVDDVEPFDLVHVLEIYGFSPSMKTTDLEGWLDSYRADGVFVKWVDDTHALAVFSSPAVARRAFATICDSRFKLRPYAEACPASKLISHRDLSPAVPRPATTVRVARRLIASALNDRNITRAVLAQAPKGCSVEDQRKRDEERRARQNMRRELRDAAWSEN
ncbi:hypothetical protein CBR_g40336 [Chara braunii]|uniref:Uncharacterized protein n=1 Tax=Chara braunii TaxID=69332 RepID=A0A388LTE9_CHABU|nr:hypothetical protein CBR_g40336 [Chara braunii]|eukprot:GBG85608.1 hypothetical protein CBR_g40336 [Chara braunii]